MSNIITNTIDTAFPVAGQDNSSEGFHNNYSAIKTALNTAASEITTLQTNSVSKITDNDLGLHNLSNAVIQNILLKVNPSGTSTIDFANSAYHKISINSTTSITVSPTSWPASGTYAKVYIEVNATASVSLTFTAAGTLLKEASLTFPYTTGIGITLWELWSTNQGGTVFVKKIGGPFA